MVRHIVFIHGYSESTLGAYFDFPSRLSAATGVPVEQIFLSAFDSLDDDVTIDDLADALESRVVPLEGRGVDIGAAAFIAHSTGALIARRWMLNRVVRNRARAAVPGADALALPSHFVSMAGANHGSSLAQTGKSWLGYMQKLWNNHILSVGKRVLTDLDYGSEFLLRLNRQWLDETLPGGDLASLFVFSMGGDSKGSDFGVDIFPPSAEPGSDNTVRVSGANLNYSFMVADPEARSITALPSRPVPHHVLRNYSHYGAQSGVWGHVADPDIAVQLARDALGCASDATYAGLIALWASDTASWTRDHPNDANATLLFALHDRGGVPVEDASVAILSKPAMDAAPDDSTDPDVVAARNAATVASLKAVSQCIVNEPIRNAVNPSSLSYYLNFAEYKETTPHYYHIEAHSESPLVAYRVIDYVGPTGPTDDAHVIKANEFTYVDVTMDRIAQQTYVLYPYVLPLDLTAWNPPAKPFPEGYLT